MFIYLLVFVVLPILSLIGIHFYLYHGRIGKYFQKLPGPPLRPVIGNMLEFQCSFVQMYQNLRDFADKYYPAYRLLLFNKPVICIRHPDDLEVLLNSTSFIQKSFGYENIQPWLGTGLLTSAGDKWRHRRRILTPAFHFDILKKYNEITNEHGEKSIADVLSQGDEVALDLNEFCSNYTLNVICDSAMGVSLNTADNSGTQYKNQVHKMGSIIFYRMVNPQIKDWMVKFMPNLKRETNDALANLNGFINKIVQERREYHGSTNNQHLRDLENDKNTVSNDVYLGKKKRLAMLDLLLSAELKGFIDDAGIKEEVATFVFEGHDTTSVSLMYTIMLLAEHKDVQEKCREEAVKVMEKNDGKLELSDLNEMNYLERCIKESLRMYPSVPSISRFMHEDLQFKHFFAPKGSQISLHIVDTHRDPNFWPEPQKFDPDRFLPELMRKRHPYSYVPFSAGSRNCIGQKFAMMELKSFMARILYNFYLEPIDYLKDVKPIIDLVMRPCNPVHTKFIKINRF